jgi:hypothetical protein
LKRGEFEGNDYNKVVIEPEKNIVDVNVTDYQLIRLLK